MKCIAFAAKTILLCALGSTCALALDAWEPGDNNLSPVLATALLPGNVPQQHDLDGSPDVDHYVFLVGPGRSYEVVAQGGSIAASFVRLDNAGVILQSSTNAQTLDYGGIVRGTSAVFVRWEEGLVPSSPRQYVRISGFGSASMVYFITLKETTLYCPRFNNTGSQVSVLIVQSALDGAQSCSFTAHFFDEGGSALHSASDTFTPLVTSPTPVRVTALAGIPALAGNKGSAQIAHSCGYGGIKAKLVALEPATGFSFDTPCTVRDQ